MRKTTITALAAAMLVGGMGLAMAQPAPGTPPGPPPGGPGWGGPGPGRGPGPGAGPHHGPRGAGGFFLGEAFARADTNNDGRVSREEATTWLQARFAEVDANKDGGVTIEEVTAFIEAQRPEGRRPIPEQARARMQERGAVVFRFIDVNLDGKITMDELRPMADAAFRAADANGDGALTRDEVRGRDPDGRRGPPMRGPGQPGAPGQPAQPR